MGLFSQDGELTREHYLCFLEKKRAIFFFVTTQMSLVFNITYRLVLTF